MAKLKNILKNIYFNPSHLSAFSGPDKLYRIVKEDGLHNLNRSTIRQWLQNQDAYSLHTPVKHKYKRNRIVPAGLDFLWDMDLADVSNIKKYNDKIQFWLIVIDTYSRHLWLEPLEKKPHTHVIKGLKKILMRKRHPRSIRSDKGSEFNNSWVKKLMKDRDIYYYITQNQTKANYAERVIRTIKSMMYRYFTHKQTYRYVEILSDLVMSYNNKPHRSLLNRTPHSIQNDDAPLWKQMYIDSEKVKPAKPIQVRKGVLTATPYTFKVEDYVRLSFTKHLFQREYHQRWSDEVFIVNQRFRRDNIPLYKVKD